MKKIAQMAAIISLGFGAIGAATADESAGSISRADVVAELKAAMKSGELAAMNGEDSGSFYLSRQVAGSTLKRQQVLANVVAARRSGNLDWMFGEDSGSFVFSRTPAAAGVHYAGPDAGESTGDAPARTASTK